MVILEPFFNIISPSQILGWNDKENTFVLASTVAAVLVEGDHFDDNRKNYNMRLQKAW